MLSDALVDFASPTLAGIKTGNMFTVKAENIYEEICSLNRIFVKRGLRLIPLKENRAGTLVYLYRPEKLKKDLEYPEARSILEEKGYPCGNCGKCVVELIRHLTSDETFPHEVGLFLGYPPGDVKGFMNDPDEGVKCRGCWKVYTNPGKAKKTFEKYKRCTAAYKKALKSGSSLEKLIV